VEDSHSLLFVQVHLFSEPWKPSQQPLASGSIAFASLKEGQDVKVYMLWTLRTHAAEVISRISRLLEHRQLSPTYTGSPLAVWHSNIRPRNGRCAWDSYVSLSAFDTRELKHVLSQVELTGKGAKLASANMRVFYTQAFKMVGILP